MGKIKFDLVECKLSTNANASCNIAQMDDWDDLRYFLAIARNGTVTAAAAKLGVNHSTVSRRIQAFEKKHAVRLFERIPSGYEITQSGENIYQKAIEIEQRAQDIERQLFGQDNRLQGKVVVTAPNMVLNDLVMPQLPVFRERYPGIDLIFQTTADLKNMAAREADIAIRLTPQPPESLVGRQVAHLSQGIYASKSYWTRNNKIHDVILWNDEVTTPSWVENYFANARIALRTDSVSTMVAAIKAGLGIAVMPSVVAEMHQDIYRLNLKLPPATWGVWVLSHVDLRSTARIRVCREFLVDILLQNKDLFEGLNSRYYESESLSNL